MFPRILDFEIWGRSVGVNSYGLMAAVGYLIAIYLTYRRAMREGMDGDAILDLCFWVLVSSLVGSRILYVLANWRVFAADPLSVFAVWEGGLVFFGGLAAALIAGGIVVRMKGLSYLRAADALAPAISLGHAFGRIGCFAVGCCWGKVCSCAWGARFGSDSVAYQDLVRMGKLDPAAASATPSLHPVQLYEALGELGIFALLLITVQRKRFHGHLLLLYVLCYGVMRFVTEMFRADPTRRYVVQVMTPGLNRLIGLDPTQPCFLSTSQMFSLIAVPAALALLLYLGRRASPFEASARMP